MTEQNKKYILGCSAVGVIASILPVVNLPIVGSMSLISGWMGRLIVLGFIVIGGVSFFYYEEAVKRFSEKYVRYTLLGVSGLIFLYLLYLLENFSNITRGVEDNPFAGLMQYAVRPGFGLYLEMVVVVFLMIFIGLFDRYLPLQTKLIQKLQSK